jgi:hypothetical protein
MDKRKEIIKALENKSDDEIDKEFDDLIMLKLDDDQFWKYVRSWKDEGSLMEQMRDWNIDEKRDAIEELKEMFKLE